MSVLVDILILHLMFGYTKIIYCHRPAIFDDWQLNIKKVLYVKSLACYAPFPLLECFLLVHSPEAGCLPGVPQHAAWFISRYFYTIFTGSLGQGIAEDTAGSRRHCLVVQFSSARKCSSGICNQLAGLWNWSVQFGSCNRLLIPLLSSSFPPSVECPRWKEGLLSSWEHSPRFGRVPWALLQVPGSLGTTRTSFFLPVSVRHSAVSVEGLQPVKHRTSVAYVLRSCKVFPI